MNLRLMPATIARQEVVDHLQESTRGTLRQEDLSAAALEHTIKEFGGYAASANKADCSSH